MTLEQKCMIEIMNERYNILNDEAIDWMKLLDLMQRHKVVTYFYKEIEEYVPIKFRCHYDFLYDRIIGKNKLMIKELAYFDKIFDANGIDYYLLKGFDLSLLLYNDPCIRPQGDIDILIDMENFERVKDILNENEYYCAFRKNNAWHYLPSGMHFMHYGGHEVVFFKKADFYAEIKIEIHERLEDISIEKSKSFFSALCKVQIGDIHCNTMDNEHMFIYLCFNTISNFDSLHGVLVNTYLRDLYDVISFLRNVALDFEKVLSLSEKYGFTERLFCTLSYCSIVYDSLELYLPSYIIDELLHNPPVLNYFSSFFVKWDIDFMTRLFDDNARKINYKKNYILKSHGTQNPNYNSKLMLADTISYRKFQYIADNSFEYSVSKDAFSSSLIVNYILNAKAVQDCMNGMQIVFSYLMQVTNIGSDDLLDCIIVRYDGSKFIKEMGGEQTSITSVNNDRQGQTLVFTVPIAHFGIIMNNELCYNIITRKHIWENCYEWGPGEFEVYFDEGKLGVLQL